MSLFPINRATRVKDADKILPIEDSLDREKNFSQNRQEFQESIDELEKKINSLVNQKKIVNSFESDLDLQTKIKVFELAKLAASSFLRKELLSVAKNILDFSLEKDIIDEEIDENITFSDYLAKFIMKSSSSKKSTSNETVKTKLGKSNPAEDKNAGFLVHYCKDIINHKIQKENSVFRSEKFSKKDLNKLLKK
jgi:hypothetical protein